MTTKIAERGDVYWIDPNPVVGHEMQNRHRFVAITLKEINRLGVTLFVPITSGGAFAREMGLTVAISGQDTTGVAICNQVRGFDIKARVAAGSAKYIERLDSSTMQEIVLRVISVIDPEL